MGLHVSLEPSAPLLQAGPLQRARPPTRRQKPQAWLPLLPKHRFGANTSSSASSCLRLPHMNSEHCTTNPPASDATTAAPMAAPEGIVQQIRVRCHDGCPDGGPHGYNITYAWFIIPIIFRSYLGQSSRNGPGSCSAVRPLFVLEANASYVTTTIL